MYFCGLICTQRILPFEFCNDLPPAKKRGKSLQMIPFKPPEAFKTTNMFGSSHCSYMVLIKGNLSLIST